MTYEDPWDEFAGIGSKYAKWETPGDTVVGTLVSRGRGQRFDGAPCPEIVVRKDDGELITIGGGQAALASALIAKRADLEPGVRVKITFTGLGQAKPGQSPPKLFDVVTKTADPTTPAPAPAPAPAPVAEPAAATVGAPADDDF